MRCDKLASFLVIYGTGEGQTAKVADHIVGELVDRGHDAMAVDAGDSNSDVSLDNADAVIVGASIHVGKHQSAVVEFVTDHREALAAMPTAFFQVSLSSATEEGRAQAAGYLEAFLEETDWHPDRVGLFGGALRYSEYGFLKRLMMKQIVKKQLPDAPTDSDIEFTDWKEVEAFAADVSAFVEGRLGVVPPSSGDSDR